MEDGTPFPELKKLLESAAGGKGPKQASASLTLALVGRAWLQLWRDRHMADKPPGPAAQLGSPGGSLLLLGCPHHAAAAQQGEGEGAAAGGAAVGGGRLNLPLFLHDLLERGVVGVAGLKEVGG